jgi:DnaT-like ssDNA binding protein
MPIPAFDTTVGGAIANSYVTEQQAEDFLDARLNSDAWTGAGADDKKRALLMAAQRLQVENWLGNRVTSTQRLAWPRIDVAKVDPVGVAFGYGGRWGYGYQFAEVYKSDEIPQPVKDAQCELALALLEGFDESGEEAMDSFTTDGVSVKLRAEKPAGGLPPKVSQLIGGLIAGNRLVRG